MSRWLSDQLDRALRRRTSGAVVVLDPDELLTGDNLLALEGGATVYVAHSWVDLRALWDLDVRLNHDHAFTVVVQAAEFVTAADLPWDVEHDAAGLVRVRCPVPHQLRDVFRAAPQHADRLAEAAAAHRDEGEILADALAFRPGDPASELALIARLRTDPATPAPLWDALARHLQTGLAQRTATSRGHLTALQDAWDDWLAHGDRAPARSELESAPGPLAALLAAGLLAPAPATAAGLPAWTAIGVAAPDPHALLAELVAQRPAPATTLAEWIDTAAWWGGVRSAASDLPAGALEEAPWDLWDELDAAFNDWLRRSYGTSLQAAATTPRGVHQIAPFLARRVDDGAKVALVVIDGLGFAQWTRLRAVTGLTVEQSTGCLAMIPTLTTVSRQAILAGRLPADFTDTIATTSAEPRRWQAFWADHGLDPRDVTYAKTLGATPDDVPNISGTAAAIVVNAIDEILHGADVLGDPQVSTSVDLWARTGFLTHLVEHASALGYEVWITSDHGNIPTTPGAVPREGQTVESAGTRVRLYPNPTLREQSRDQGLIWDPPGLSPGQLNPLFPAGRRGFHTTGVRVSHGGTSLDEVLVPFLKVTP